MHINEHNQSEISDKNFFLSQKSDPKIELVTLLEHKTCENICHYPARYRYLSQQLDLNLSFDHCEELQSYLKETRGQSANVVFASSFLGSPASYFGHTFISLFKENNLHFSKTLGYAAELPQSGNPFDLILKGISGEYKGRYVLTPYYQMIESYNVVEQRTLYEYKLDLTQEEIENMLWHSYELKDINVPYKFFTENCAYEVFWLIEAAKPSLKIREKLKPYVIPYETVQVLKDEGIVLAHKKREPLIDHLYKVYRTLTTEEKKIFSEWKESSHKERDLRECTLSESTKNTFAELINGYYDILFKKEHTSKADFYEVKKIQFKQTLVDDSLDFEPRKPHKISLGRMDNNGQRGEILQLRPVLFDRFEERDSLLSESTLEFLTLSLSNVNSVTKVEKFDLITIESFNKQFDFYAPKSWRIYLGSNRTFHDNTLSPVAEMATGLTYGNDILSAYGLAQMALYPMHTAVNGQVLFGISLWADKGHFTVDFKKSLINGGGASKNEKLFSFYYPLTKTMSLKVSDELEYKEKKLYIDIKF